MRTALKILIIMTIIFTNSKAQFTNTFIQIAHTMNYGHANSIAIGHDGTIFLANAEAGLRAYEYNGIELSIKAYTNDFDDDDAMNVAVGPDGTVFLSSLDGLHAFEYNGTTFDQTAYIAYQYRYGGVDIEVDKNGIIYRADGDDGLRVFTYNGESFTEIDHIDHGNYWAHDVAIGTDSTIFLASTGDGLRAYRYTGMSLVNTAHIHDVPNVLGVAVGPDGTVFTANRQDGLRAYSYEDFSFTNIGHIDVETWWDSMDESVTVAKDGTIYLATNDGVRVYSFDDSSFTEISIVDSIIVNDIEVNSNGTIFLAHYWGLKAYQLEGESFVNTANFGSGIATAVTVNSDGTVFLADAFDGLWAYNYNGDSFSISAYLHSGFKWSHRQSLPLLDLGIDSGGTLFLLNDADGLKVFNYDGSSFNLTAHESSPIDTGLSKNIAVGLDGIIFLASTGYGGLFFPTDDDGLRAFSFTGNSLTKTAHVDDPGWAQDVAVGQDGTVFLANGSDGLRVYSYTGTNFINTGHVPIDSGSADNVTVGSNGMVFITVGYPIYELRAYHCDSDTIINTAQIDISTHEYGKISAGPENTVFLADDYGGLFAYSYDDTSFTNAAYIYEGGYALDVTVGPDGTIFLANGSKGLIAYKYSGYTTEIENKIPKVPEEYLLKQNYPNPFNPTTTIEFTLPTSEFVELKVFNILGKEVSTLVSDKLNQGNHTYTFDGKNLASGIYYYQLVAGEYEQVRKMIKLK